jgi:tetratricopeptide (TPR) repeat protein
MPFGTKKDPITGKEIDFDRIYQAGIQPAIDAAGMEPIRADEEIAGGIIHKPMFERLMLCDYAIADLTTGNANVFYELGIRHAVRPSTTLSIFECKQQIPFDVRPMRALPYEFDDKGLFGDVQAAKLKGALTDRLIALRDEDEKSTDSPIFQLLADYKKPDIKRIKTDVFRERTRYAADIKDELTRARDAKDKAAVHAVQAKLGDLGHVETGVLIDLFLSYRALGDHESMVSLYDAMPPELQRMVMVREQLGFALNRLGQREEAVRVFEEVIQEHGDSSETCGMLGRVYKDRWAEAKTQGSELKARGVLDRAIDVYERGFESDCRDAYPGINAVTLLDIKGDEAALARKSRLLPVVRFAVEQRVKSGNPDYWDYATLLELAVLDDDKNEAVRASGAALSHLREKWEAKTTANNLSMIRDARADSGRDVALLDEIIEALSDA